MPPCMYVCLRIYIYIFPFLHPRLTYTHVYTHTRTRVHAYIPMRIVCLMVRGIFWTSKRTEKVGKDRGLYNNRRITFSEFSQEKKRDFLSSRLSEATGAFSSAHITRPPPTCIDFYTYIHIHMYLDATTVKTVHVNDAKSCARVIREIITLRGANARIFSSF